MNAFHEDICRRHKFNERNYRLATAAPRGNAKSTWRTLIKPLHDVCYGTERFIVILSSTTPLSNKKLKDIRSEIRNNRGLADVYGTKFPKKTVGESEFAAYSDFGVTHFAAVGRGSELRGIRIGQYRPTKIISDDVEHSEEVYNEKSRQKTEEWYFEDVTNAGDEGTNFDIVGTVLHRESLLSKLLKNPKYEASFYKSIISWSEHEELWEDWRKIYRAIEDPQRIDKANAFYELHKDKMLKGTEVLWPEKKSYLALMEYMEEIGRRAFMKEQQNEPLGADETVFEKFHYYREVEKGFEMEETKVVYPWEQLVPLGAMDPSTGKVKPTKGKMGDYTVIIIAYLHVISGRVFIHADWTKRASPTKYIQEIFNLYEKFKFTKFAVETNLYRNLLLPNIQQEKKLQEKAGKKFSLSFYDVEQTENKRERITRLEPKVNYGYMVFNRALTRDFMNQWIDFPHAANDDAPDCGEIVWNLAHNRYSVAPMNVDAQAG